MLVRSRELWTDSLRPTSSWPMHDTFNVDQAVLEPLDYKPLDYTFVPVASWCKLCEICPVQTEILTASNTTFRTRTEPRIPVQTFDIGNEPSQELFNRLLVSPRNSLKYHKLADLRVSVQIEQIK
ncbi:hypothetical protein PENANT_c005G10239 [Penicillium antarcticum]|uniref:Uncharacterized protein n=1 Tax=Penicillium antarcticum TaxID=416450 RepID=A0A1V6QEG2_9EURO|nr:hypothetical protein PENANT_c005G10239 [Penicillium antarcticum]